jgi:integrase
MPALMQSAMRDLRESAPEQLAALLLFAGCGLRKSEADAARWCWLNPEQATLTVKADATFAPKTHASEAPVYVDPGFAAALLSLRPADAPADAYILAPNAAALPVSTFTRYRAAHVLDKLTTWLKAHGVNTRTPLHDLRREFGSFIAQTADIFTASRQLRHSSIQVTASFYTQQRRQVAPSLGAMLAGKPETKAANP